MKLFKLTAMSVAALALLSSSTCSKQETAAPGKTTATEKTSGKMEKQEFTPEFLNELGRVGAPQVSPDGKKVLYGVTYYDIDAERAAYEGFWDRVSIEATKKAYMDKAIAGRDAAIAERDAANARAAAATEKLRQTVCGLKDIGMPIDQIAKVTGLKAEEVEALWGCEGQTLCPP